MIIKLFCYEIRKRKEISKFKNKDVSVKRHVIRILDQKPQYIYLSQIIKKKKKNVLHDLKNKYFFYFI